MDDTLQYFRVVSETEMEQHLNTFGLIDVQDNTTKEWFLSIYHFDYDYIEQIQNSMNSNSMNCIYKHYVDTDKRHVITLTNGTNIISFKEYETIRLLKGSYKFFVCQLFVDFTGSNRTLLEFLEQIEEQKEYE